MLAVAAVVPTKEELMVLAALVAVAMLQLETLLPIPAGVGADKLIIYLMAAMAAQALLFSVTPLGIINPPGIEELRPQAGVNIGGTSIETPPGNLVAYYKFDEGHGLVVNNSGIGGSSANGTLASGTSSPVWVNDGK